MPIEKHEFPFSGLAPLERVKGSVRRDHGLEYMKFLQDETMRNHWRQSWMDSGTIMDRDTCHIDVEFVC